MPWPSRVTNGREGHPGFDDLVSRSRRLGIRIKLTAEATENEWLISQLERSDVGTGRNDDCASPRGRARPSKGWRRC